MAQNQNVFGPSVLRDRPPELDNIGSAPANSGIVAEEFGFGAYRQTKLTLTSFPMQITRTSSSIAANSGTAAANLTATGVNAKPGLLYTFPEGFVWVSGAVVNVTIAGATIADTANAVTAVGSVQANAGATLTSTEADIVASATTAIASSAGSRAANSLATYIAGQDGTSTAGTVFFNFATADDVTATGLIYVTGTVYINWQIIGDR